MSTTLKSGIRRAAISTPPHGRPAYRPLGELLEPNEREGSSESSPAEVTHLAHLERRKLLVEELVSRTLYEEAKKRQLRAFEGVAHAGLEFLRALKAVARAREARQSTAAALYDLGAGL
jgi:hypothetical protein